MRDSWASSRGKVIDVSAPRQGRVSTTARSKHGLLIVQDNDAGSKEKRRQKYTVSTAGLADSSSSSSCSSSNSSYGKSKANQ